MTADDPYDLEHFVTAQTETWRTALAELRKRSHWMWFTFPQLRGLGRSPMAAHYGLSGLAEARAYLAHPILAPRLREATEATLPHARAGASALFGSPDDLKFRSSMTLFAAANDEAAAPFEEALRQYFDGQPDRRTLALLGH